MRENKSEQVDNYGENYRGRMTKKYIKLMDANGKKLAIEDITDWQLQELIDFFKIQEYLGRRWEYCHSNGSTN